MPSRLVVVLVVFLAVSVADAASQMTLQRGGRVLPLGKDTLCFRYRFLAGDRMLLRVEAHDSVLFPGRPKLYKNRLEWYAVTCDSVSGDSLYHIRQQLLSVLEEQRAANDPKPSIITESPWVGRVAHLTIDTLGRRRRARMEGDTIAGVTPGGMFQPVLLPSLGFACGRQNESALVSDTVLLAENGVPEPAVFRETMHRIGDYADTLGMRFQQMQYTQTGIARVNLTSTPEQRMVLDGILNAFGNITMEPKRAVPYHVFATCESKLTLRSPGGRETEGKQLTTMHIQLVELESSDPRRRYHLDDGSIPPPPSATPPKRTGPSKPKKR